jgi:hypothetical protein
MNEDLKFIFQNTNEWLRFGEAKNAALLVMNSTLFAVVANTQSPPFGFKISLVLFFLSSMAQFASFLPLGPFLFGAQALQSPLHPPSMAKGELSEILPSSELDLEAQNDHFRQSLIKQTQFNAKVCGWKYKCFEVGVVLTFLAFCAITWSKL